MRLKLYTRSNTKQIKDRQTSFACLFLKKLKKVIALSITVLVFFACSSTPRRAKIVKDITFDNSHISDFGNTYYDHGLKEEVIYFYDKINQKAVFLYNTKGQLKTTVPLQEAISAIDNIGRITLIALDTIVINSNITNEVVLINSTGHVYQKINLDNKLVDKKGNLFELMSSMYPNQQNGNCLIYNCSWRSSLKDTASNNASDTDNLNYFFGNMLESPYFVTISDILSEKPKIAFHTYGFYKQISGNGYVLAEPPLYTSIGKHIFVNSFYSDKLFKIDTSNFTIQKAIQITSEYTKIGTNPVKIKEDAIGKIQDSMTYKQKTAGRIERLLYNKNQKEYYCIVKHQTTAESYDRKQIPFSVIILDTNFIKRKEYLFDNFQYDHDNSLMTDEGLLLLKNDTTKSLIKNAKITYSLFSFN
ncbi:MAG: hypothetical protein V4506_16530, partial [Bacteroidota bacterium]